MFDRDLIIALIFVVHIVLLILKYVLYFKNENAIKNKEPILLYDLKKIMLYHRLTTCAFIAYATNCYYVDNIIWFIIFGLLALNSVRDDINKKNSYNELKYVSRKN